MANAVVAVDVIVVVRQIARNSGTATTATTAVTAVVMLLLLLLLLLLIVVIVALGPRTASRHGPRRSYCGDGAAPVAAVRVCRHMLGRHGRARRFNAAATAIPRRTRMPCTL